MNVNDAAAVADDYDDDDDCADAHKRRNENLKKTKTRKVA